MKEIWKEIEKNNSKKCKYFVSNFGRIKSVKDGERITYLKFRTVRNKYFSVTLSSSNPMFVHQIVGKLFLPNPENKPFINHKDRNGFNNHISNLEWVTHKENIQHSMLNGGHNVGITMKRFRIGLETLKYYYNISGIENTKEFLDYIEKEFKKGKN